jgi:photosynthetic reaction center H subunit
MPDCELAEGAPDVRGWEVTTPTLAHVGVVKDLLIDLDAMRVRYLDVVIDATPGAPRRVLLPIGRVWINPALDEVVLPVASDLDALLDYDPKSFNREFEQNLLSRLGHDGGGEHDFYASSAFNDWRFHDGRSAPATCGRRGDDGARGACSASDAARSVPEAANGVELPIVADAAD